MKQNNMMISSMVHKIVTAIATEGGTALLVGGCTRDYWLNKTIKDIDIEVFSIESYESLAQILSRFGRINRVGKQFSVLKLSTDGLELDFSLPRKETKVSQGHTGFHVSTDSTMAYEEAASRRDFTINSIGYNPIKKEWLDPFNGIQDIKNKILKHIGPSFAEDPLRVYRAIQFAARFEFDIDTHTQSLIKQMPLNELPKERIFEEFKKLLLQANKPSIGFEWLRKLKMLPLFPELNDLIHVPQDPKWHPEGDVWQHTMRVLDEMATLTHNKAERLTLMMAALCHDFGKPATTKFMNGRFRSIGHEVAGLNPTRSFIRRLTDEKELLETVLPLVKEHMNPASLHQSHQSNKVSQSAIRKLSTRVNIQQLVQLSRADHYGKGAKNHQMNRCEAADWLEAQAKELEVETQPPEKIINGKMLMEMGMSPGTEMGKLIKAAYQAQLNGEFDSIETSIRWFNKRRN